MNLEHRIKNLREQFNLTQQELADKVNCRKRTVSAWEQGTGIPDSMNRKKLCEVFGISEAILFGAPPTPKLSPEILEALQDPVAVKGLLIIHKNSQEIKDAIKALLETIPSLSAEKRQAILALCR